MDNYLKEGRGRVPRTSMGLKNYQLSVIKLSIDIDYKIAVTFPSE